jgi:hypothetical protein
VGDGKARDWAFAAAIPRVTPRAVGDSQAHLPRRLLLVILQNMADGTFARARWGQAFANTRPGMRLEMNACNTGVPTMNERANSFDKLKYNCKQAPSSRNWTS